MVIKSRMVQPDIDNVSIFDKKVKY
jgi:hypothetical protein